MTRAERKKKIQEVIEMLCSLDDDADTITVNAREIPLIERLEQLEARVRQLEAVNELEKPWRYK